MQTAQSRSLFSLYLAYFADYFSWGAAIAFLAVYIGTDQSPFSHIYWNPQLALGIAIACFPIGEVIGSPILGDLSDLLGRRIVLLYGTIGSVLSLGVCALSLWNGWFLLFLIGQLVAGFFAGKQSMAQAAIAEIDSGTKAQKLAFLSVIGGVAWIIGPYLGSLLLQPRFIEWGGFIWPSLMACFIFAVSWICTYFLFEDVYEPNNNYVSVVQFAKGSCRIFSLAFRESIFFVFLMNLIGWYLVVVSLSYFLIQRFGLTSSDVGVFNSYFALSFTLGGILGTVWMIHRFRARKILFWMQMMGAVGLFSLFGAETVSELWIYLALPAITEALIYPAYQIILSDYACDQSQGKVFGLINAANGACQLLAYWILAVFPPEYIGGAILLSALLFLISAAFIPFTMRKKILIT